MSPSCPLKINFEAQSGDNLFRCNLLELAKNINFEPKVGHCTAVIENLCRAALNVTPSELAV
jgi:hypothetical protein